MALTTDEIVIVNQANARIGAKSITLAVQASPEGIYDNLFYGQTRNSLLRSFEWPFASGRIELVAGWATSIVYTTDQYVWSSSLLYKCAIAHTSGTFATDLAAVRWTLYSTRPSHEWDYQYSLPADYIRLKSSYLESDGDLPNERWTIEGTLFLTNDDEVQLNYVKKITDPVVFDPLFTEVLVLQLALKLVNPLAKVGSSALKQEIKQDIGLLLPRVRTICRQEINTTGRSDWNLQRYQSATTTV